VVASSLGLHSVGLQGGIFRARQRYWRCQQGLLPSGEHRGIGDIGVATTEDVPVATSEPPAQTVARPESAGHLIVIAIGWFVLAQLIGIVTVGSVEGVLRVHDQSVSLDNPIGQTTMGVLINCILLIVVRGRSVVVGRGNRRSGVDDKPITRWWLLIELAFLTGACAFVASSFWNAKQPHWVSSWRGEGPWVLTAYTVVAVVVAPLAEELFFRGWLWTGLRQHWRAFPTALISCGLWLIVHIDRGFLLPIILIPLAIILGFARHLCGIRAAIILHALYNLVCAVVLVILLTPAP
jgi:membrane protease YdiL (CAAX protease family)